ncbi:MAG: diguanylate cyclase [Bacillota bacterium]
MGFEKSLSMGIPFIAFLSYCALLVLSAKNPRSKVAKIFLAYLILMLVWSLGSFMMRTGTFPGPLAWNRFMLFGTTGIPFVFFHFSLEILGRPKYKKIVFFSYALYSLFAISNFFGMIVSKASMQDGAFVYTLGPLAETFAIVGGFYILISAVLLTREGFENPNSFWSNRLVYPSVGSILMLLGSTLNLFPGVGKYPVDILTNTINAFLLTYAIYRYRLLNITITLRKGLVYSVLTVLLTGSYVLVAFLLERVARIELGYSTFALALVMAVIITFVFDPAKYYLKVWIDRAFFREQYDYRETLKEFSHLMTSILDLDQLAQSTLDLLTKALQVKHGAILLADSNSNFYVHTSVNINQEVSRGVRMDKTSPIVRWLNNHDEHLILDHIETIPDFQSLWQREKEDLEEMQADLLIGIKMQTELIGILILSKKMSSDPYTDDDRELLITLANEAAVAINNAKMYTEVKSQAIRDELTKLYNYRFFQEFVDKEIARYKRSGQSFAVIFMDLDLFKAYNDIFGHLAGDQALWKVGQAIMESIRTSDIAARYGGDEFAIVLPGTSMQEAMVVADRIRGKVRTSFPGAGHSTELLTISLGVVSYPDHGEDKQQILSYADRALYQAKHLGRNRVFMPTMAESLTNQGEETVEATEAEKNFLKKQVEDAYLSTIYTLAAAINARDNYTYQHSEMVTLYSIALAEALGLSEENKKVVRHAAMLHDIGKIGIPEYILNKPGSLSQDEREVIEKHVNIAEAIVKQTPFLRSVAPIILHHHEAYDGTGYPGGLKGEEIPLESRMLAIADAYHAMTSNRPYRLAIANEVALQQLITLAGKQFDPNLVPLFVRVLKKDLGNHVVEEARVGKEEQGYVLSSRSVI